MADSKHTPGPWMAGKQATRFEIPTPLVPVVCPEIGNTVAYVHTVGDAAVIAEVPAMLAALRSALTYIGDTDTDGAILARIDGEATGA